MDKSQTEPNQKPVDYLNFFLPNKASLYDILESQKHYYLPNLGSRAITEEYLLEVAKDRVFTIKKEDIKIGKLSKTIFLSELIEILTELAGSKPLGFNAAKAPNKEWLINCIYTLNPNHSIFKSPSAAITRDFPENFFDGVALPMKRQKGKGFFKRTKEERERLKKVQKEKTLQRKNLKIKKLKMELEELEKLENSKKSENIENMIKFEGFEKFQKLFDLNDTAKGIAIKYNETDNIDELTQASYSNTMDITPQNIIDYI